MPSSDPSSSGKQRPATRGGTVRRCGLAAGGARGLAYARAGTTRRVGARPRGSGGPNDRAQPRCPGVGASSRWATNPTPGAGRAVSAAGGGPNGWRKMIPMLNGRC
ncbi:unnamed protein product [Urochloa humidicola]